VHEFDGHTDGQTDRQTSTAIAHSNRVRCALKIIVIITTTNTIINIEPGTVGVF